VTQDAKAQQFRALHEAPGAFVIANVWDGGSVRMMAGLGFAALATSSGASAGLLGRRDGRVMLNEALGQARVICGATDKLSRDWGNVVRDALRHSHESALIAAGVNIVTVSRRLGHGSPAITLTVYAHLFTNTDTTAATAIEAAMRPRP
jgi:2-methylisocitrate lyase-like PEP mutase family enzyme